MYTLIIIFYVSFLGIISMIALKGHEVKTGRQSLVSRLGQGSDHIFSAVFGAVRHAFSLINRQTFTAIAHWVAYHVLLRIRTLYIALKHRFISNPHGKHLIDAVRGKGEISHHGASFFLRRISSRD